MNPVFTFMFVFVFVLMFLFVTLIRINTMPPELSWNTTSSFPKATDVVTLRILATYFNTGLHEDVSKSNESQEKE